ncbi:hypothetical protein I540_3329 [Mycobacteroides abscessus subsp. bolletii 1513]|uniref:Uncharacterized protein n=1 Tax=Mycobacteroides abscessus subsp. bolletii 1513 TaxID=1299321 RepID=X8DPE5_9MYCO|nr:hypothetical protein I540_3329 [Mycobacteroides abscessus subsp. bolletii 1513]
MCRSYADFDPNIRDHRRCKMTEHKRAAATASRQENRTTMRCVSSNVRDVLGPAGATAVAALPPSMLSNLMVSLEAVSPGIAAELLRSPSGALRRVPGMHNNVFTEVRERTGDASEKINRGKSDPMAVSKVQLASALCERGLIVNGVVNKYPLSANADPLEASAELDRIDTRIDAIACGAIVPPAPGTKFEDLPARVQNFYRRHTLDEVASLTAVSQRMSDKLFDDVTEQAQVAAAPRRPDPIIEQIGGDQAHVLTVGSLMARADSGDNAVQIADGVVLARGENGNLSVAVDGLRLPVDSDTRVNELIARIPDVDFDQFTSVPAGGNSSGMNTVVQSMMVGKSPGRCRCDWRPNAGSSNAPSSATLPWDMPWEPTVMHTCSPERHGRIQLNGSPRARTALATVQTSWPRLPASRASTSPAICGSHARPVNSS